MKTLLLASTALVATAGIAAAEMTVTGSAEIGVYASSDDNTTTTGVDESKARFFTDWDVTFSGSGETDGGVSFGASIDLDEGGSGAAAVANNDDDGGATAFVSYGGATFTMGDTDGAYDKALSEVNVAAGSINDDETTHAGFDGNGGMDGSYDGQIARLDYAFEGFTGSLSAEMDDSAADGDTIWGIGVAYNAELAGLTLGVGLGYQTAGDDQIMGISLKTTFDNGLMAAINYDDREMGGVDDNHWAIGLGYAANGLAVGVNYGEYDSGASGFGLAATYDLGGGLSAQAGYGSSDVGGVESDSWSLGLAMSF